MSHRASTRVELLRELVEGSRTPNDVTNELAEFGWDSDRELIVFTERHAVAILRRYLQGECTDAFLAEWANAIEGRDDIALDPSGRGALSDFIFEMSNPEITTKLSPERAAWWLERLSSVDATEL